MTIPTGSSRAFFDPVVYLRDRLGITDLEHITCDPSLRSRHADYRIIRGSSHDGTSMFTDETIFRALGPLVRRETYYKPNPPRDEQHMRGVRYVVGLARLATVYGIVKLPVGRYPGQRERICVPVRVILP